MTVTGEDLRFEFSTPLYAENVIFIETAIAEVLNRFGFGGKRSANAAAEISSFCVSSVDADPGCAGSDFSCAMSMNNRSCKLEFRINGPLDCGPLSKTIAVSKHWSSIVKSSELDPDRRRLSVQLSFP